MWHFQGSIHVGPMWICSPGVTVFDIICTSKPHLYYSQSAAQLIFRKIFIDLLHHDWYSITILDNGWIDWKHIGILLFNRMLWWKQLPFQVTFMLQSATHQMVLDLMWIIFVRLDIILIFFKGFFSASWKYSIDEEN